MSNDDKAKIVAGLPAVHRLNNLNHKFFMRGSQPNFPDHDVLRSGCLIEPQGYMILRRKRKQTGDCTPTIVENIYVGDTGSPTEATIVTQNNSDLQEEREESDVAEPGVRILQSDDLQEELPQVDAEGLAFFDEILQLDGAADGTDESESEEDFDMEWLNEAQPQRKRRRIDSEDEADLNVETMSDDETTPPVQTNVADRDSSSENEEFEMPEFPQAKFVTKDGRKHVTTPHTGPAFVFFKSHQTKPSSISRHVNDILTIANVEKSLKTKPNLLLILDDGLDWGGRGLQTLYYLGELWRLLNLDLLVIARNAPGDSAKNPIEQ